MQGGANRDQEAAVWCPEEGKAVRDPQQGDSRISQEGTPWGFCCLWRVVFPAHHVGPREKWAVENRPLGAFPVAGRLTGGAGNATHGAEHKRQEAAKLLAAHPAQLLLHS